MKTWTCVECGQKNTYTNTRCKACGAKSPALDTSDKRQLRDLGRKMRRDG